MSFLDTSLDLQEFNFWPGYKSAALGARGGGWARAAAGAGVRKSIPLRGEVGAGEIYLPWLAEAFVRIARDTRAQNETFAARRLPGRLETDGGGCTRLGREGAGASSCPTAPGQQLPSRWAPLRWATAGCWGPESSWFAAPHPLLSFILCCSSNTGLEHARPELCH